MNSSNDGVTIYPIILPTKYSLKSFNFYLLEEPDSLTLIDAGIDTDECWEYFNKALSENGFSVRNLTRILLTHNHEDHVGIVNRITTIKDVPIFAHSDSIYRLKRDRDYFALRIEFFKKLYQEMDCGEFGERQINRLCHFMKKKENSIIQGEIIPIEEPDLVSRLQVIETPGHSPDHLVFWDVQRKYVFAGDHLVSHVSSNAIVEPDREGNRILTLKQYIQSLQKCLELNIERAYPGHGKIIENPKELLKYRLERIQQKSQKIMVLIKDGNRTASQIAQAFYKEKYQSEFSLVMSEIIGHLDNLEESGKVGKDKKNGIWYYHLTSF